MLGTSRMTTSVSDKTQSKIVTVTSDSTASKNALDVNFLGNLIPSDYDYIALTYVSAGNGVGEIETVVYKSGGSGGTTVATLTLGYDASDRLSTITRS